jgi:hypothetical protein
MKYTLKHHVRSDEHYSVTRSGWVKEFLEGDIEVEIDIDRIVRQIADQAIRNRSGRARDLRGLIEAKVTKRYPREPIFRLPENVRLARGSEEEE